MPILRTTPLLRGATAALLALTGAGLVAVPAATATDSPGCTATPDAALGVSITSPAPDATVKLAKTPRFAVRGLVTGALAADLASVTLLADGVELGAATLDPGAAGAWSLLTSAPPGRHVLVACARTTGGDVAAAEVHFTAQRPADAATVVAPDAARLSAGDAANLTAVTPGTLTFKRVPRLLVGGVVAAAPSALAPDGLLRRVTGIRADGASVVVDTVPASLTDAFWKARIDVVQPLRTTADPAGPTLTWADGMAAGPGLNGAQVTGTLALAGPATYSADVTLALNARIDTDWAWGPNPAVHVVSGGLTVSGTTSASADAAFTGSGTLEIYADPDGKRQVAYPAIALSTSLPVWVRPTATLTLHAKATLADSLELDAAATTTSSAGLALAADVASTVSDVVLAGSAPTAPTGSAGSTGTARLDATLAVTLRADGKAAHAKLTSGFATTALGGCPGEVRTDALASTKSDGAALFGPVADPAGVAAGTTVGLRSDPFFGCSEAPTS